MTTLIARDASGTAACPATGSWCADCDGRPCQRLEAFPAGNPRALTEADRLAATAGHGAHVHFAAHGDQFVVVMPVAVVTA
ncbi:hypothetical protein [Streptomyces sp. NPDC051546]|uniref:hypothetical protein n=1 Tax=Streptomyces sp. NPDC051546 TaxID=3365655 RepID=UPI0037914C88